MPPFRALTRRTSAARALLHVLLPVAAAACAGTTVGSGVGEASLDRPPFYAGRLAAAGEATGYLPIVYQAGEDPIFEPEQGPGSALHDMIAEMNAWLESAGPGKRLVPTSSPAGGAPDVQFRCETDVFGDCDEESADDIHGRRMRLAVTRPSHDWAAWAQREMTAAGVTRLLLITVETSDYWPRQVDWRGRKAIELGTGYAVALPWLTALDRPISVVQVTGVLLGADGRAIRIGAEGMLARRTAFLASAVGAQRVIGGDDIAELRQARRDDLRGEPPVWQVALHNLIAQLSGEVDPILR